MKKVLILIVVSITAIGCSVGGSSATSQNKDVKKENTPFSCMFYNVENLFDTYDDPIKDDNDFLPESNKQWDNVKYKKKLDQLAKAVQFVDKKFPALIGLCEVENETVLKDFADQKEMKRHNYGFVHFESKDKRGIDVALLYKKANFSVEDKFYIRPKFKDPDLKTRDILYVKGLLNGNLIHIYVNHWPSRRSGQKESEYKRVNVAKRLKSHIDGVMNKDKNANIIVMGDFNDYPTNKSIVDILKATGRSTDSFSSLVNLAAKPHRENRGSHCYKKKWGMLDQIMVSKAIFNGENGFKLKSKEVLISKKPALIFNHPKYGKVPSRTFSRDNYHPNGFSDHLPISITFK